MMSFNIYCKVAKITDHRYFIPLIPKKDLEIKGDKIFLHDHNGLIMGLGHISLEEKFYGCELHLNLKKNNSIEFLDDLRLKDECFFEITFTDDNQLLKVKHLPFTPIDRDWETQ